MSIPNNGNPNSNPNGNPNPDPHNFRLHMYGPDEDPIAVYTPYLGSAICPEPTLDDVYSLILATFENVSFILERKPHVDLALQNFYDVMAERFAVLATTMTHMVIAVAHAENAIAAAKSQKGSQTK